MPSKEQAFWLPMILLNWPAKNLPTLVWADDTLSTEKLTCFTMNSTPFSAAVACFQKLQHTREFCCWKKIFRMRCDTFPWRKIQNNKIISASIDAGNGYALSNCFSVEIYAVTDSHHVDWWRHLSESFIMCRIQSILTKTSSNIVIQQAVSCCVI